MSKIAMKFEGVKFLEQAERLADIGDMASSEYSVENVIHWKEGETSRKGTPYQRNGGLVIIKLKEGKNVSLFLSDLIAAQLRQPKAKFVKLAKGGSQEKGYDGEVLTSGTISVSGGQIGI